VLPQALRRQCKHRLILALTVLTSCSCDPPAIFNVRPTLVMKAPPLGGKLAAATL
jgi:hypothetical protein